MANRDDLEKPKGLSAKGNAAYDVIVGFMWRHELTYTGGCKAFYSPKEWAARGEEYGLKSELIVCHDGGDLSDILRMESLCSKLFADLSAIGVYAERCTGWHAAIYKA